MARRGGPRGRRGPQASIGILNAAGDTVATLNGPLSPGLQRVRWNMRVQQAEEDAKSPAELRDSLQAARAMVEVSDSLVEAGAITRAAALLGMKRPRLSQLVKQYGLSTVPKEKKS